MFKHNWAWIKLATDNFSTVLTRNLLNPRDCTPLREVGIEIIVLVYITIETPARDMNFGLVGVHVY